MMHEKESCVHSYYSKTNKSGLAESIIIHQVSTMHACLKTFAESRDIIIIIQSNGKFKQFNASHFRISCKFAQ